MLTASPAAPTNAPAPTNVLTIDVEDWFHILGLNNAPDFSTWSQQVSRVETNTRHLLDLLKSYDAKATFFVLGWVAESFPDVVREIETQGHEIASHGYRHELISAQTPDAFRRDIEKSLECLARLTTKPVLGYRAPGFSITEQTLWALDILLELGLTYDASVFPMKRNHGGYNQFQERAGWLITPKGNRIFEVPVSCNRILNRKIYVLGGGYFRLAPYGAIAAAIQQLHRRQQPAVVYLHPREIDPQQPRLAMNRKRTFMSYVGLSTTESKLRNILKAYRWRPISDLWRAELATAVPLDTCTAPAYARP